MMRRAYAGGVVVILAAISCRNVLGLGDPIPYGPDGGGPNGELPVVTEDNSACGFANLVTDPKNCGRCGHDCRDSRCERGRCVPVVLTTADSDVFAVHDGRVFTVDKGIIIRVEANRDRFPVATSSVGTPRAMLASSLHILWSGDTTGVRVCSVTGCGADDPIQLSATDKKTGPLAELRDLNQLYPYIWANYSDFTVEKAGSPGAPTVLSTATHVMEAQCAPAFAQSDGGAYVYDTPGKHYWQYRASTDAGGRDAGSDVEPCALTANGKAVFYTDETNVWRAEIQPDGALAPRTNLASGLLAPRVLAADDDFVYWAASTPETDIVRCRATGCVGAPEVVVEAIPAIQRLAVEGPFVYFSTLLNATLGRVIYKVAK